MKKGKLVVDELDRWVAEHTQEWSEKYPGKYLAIVDKQVVAIEDDTLTADKKARELYSGRIPYVVYIPKKEEMITLLCLRRFFHIGYCTVFFNQ